MVTFVGTCNDFLDGKSAIDKLVYDLGVLKGENPLADELWQNLNLKIGSDASDYDMRLTVRFYLDLYVKQQAADFVTNFNGTTIEGRGAEVQIDGQAFGQRDQPHPAVVHAALQEVYLAQMQAVSVVVCHLPGEGDHLVPLILGIIENSPKLTEVNVDDMGFTPANLKMIVDACAERKVPCSAISRRS